MKTINRKQSNRFDRDLLPALRSVLSESLKYSLGASWVNENRNYRRNINPKYLQFFASPKTFTDVNDDAINCIHLLDDKIQWLTDSLTGNDKSDSRLINAKNALSELRNHVNDQYQSEYNAFNINDGLVGIFIKDYQAVLLVNVDKYENATWSFMFFSWSSKFDENILPSDNEVMFSDLLNPDELNSNLREYFDNLRSDDAMIAQMANDIDANKKRFLNQMILHPTNWYFMTSDVMGVVDIRKTVSDALKYVPTFILDPRDADFTCTDIKDFLERWHLYDKFYRCLKAVYKFYKFMEGDPEFMYDYDDFMTYLPGGSNYEVE